MKKMIFLVAVACLLSLPQSNYGMDKKDFLATDEGATLVLDHLKNETYDELQKILSSKELDLHARDKQNVTLIGKIVGNIQLKDDVRLRFVDVVFEVLEIKKEYGTKLLAIDFFLPLIIGGDFADGLLLKINKKFPDKIFRLVFEALLFYEITEFADTLDKNVAKCMYNVLNRVQKTLKMHLKDSKEALDPHVLFLLEKILIGAHFREYKEVSRMVLDYVKELDKEVFSSIIEHSVTGSLFLDRLRKEMEIHDKILLNKLYQNDTLEALVIFKDHVAYIINCFKKQLYGSIHAFLIRNHLIVAVDDTNIMVDIVASSVMSEKDKQLFLKSICEGVPLTIVKNLLNLSMRDEVPLSVAINTKQWDLAKDLVHGGAKLDLLKKEELESFLSALHKRKNRALRSAVLQEIERQKKDYQKNRLNEWMNSVSNAYSLFEYGYLYSVDDFVELLRLLEACKNPTTEDTNKNRAKLKLMCYLLHTMPYDHEKVISKVNSLKLPLVSKAIVMLHNQSELVRNDRSKRDMPSPNRADQNQSMKFLRKYGLNAAQKTIKGSNELV